MFEFWMTLCLLSISLGLAAGAYAMFWTGVLHERARINGLLEDVGEGKTENIDAGYLPDARKKK